MTDVSENATSAEPTDGQCPRSDAGSDPPAEANYPHAANPDPSSLEIHRIQSSDPRIHPQDPNIHPQDPESGADPETLSTFSLFSSLKQDGEFLWDAETQGLILGCFFYGYAASHVPGGLLAERYGGKWLMGKQA